MSFIARAFFKRFNTQPPEGGWQIQTALQMGLRVSTHSRLKAAGDNGGVLCLGDGCFNTQPPEGGWDKRRFIKRRFICFNTQPPEGGWRRIGSRHRRRGCFNTQPPEGGWPSDRNQCV